MMKMYFFLALVLLTIKMGATSSTWDVIDKSMAGWNKNGGSETNKSWTYYIGNELKNNPNEYSITQGEGFVNLTKTYVNATSASALIHSQEVIVTTNTPYTVEFKARINPINKTQFPDLSGIGWEQNTISARINKKTIDIYLGCNFEGNGYVTLKKDFPGSESDRLYIDISEWHIYTFVVTADNTAFDFYIDDELVFENAVTKDMNISSNILRFGTASERARCNIDVMYAKMGTGAYHGTPKINSIDLSAKSQGDDKDEIIIVTVNTFLINDYEKLLISLVDDNDEIVVTAIETIVMQNEAKVDFPIPAGLARGKYYVKSFVPSGKIGSFDIAPQKVEYLITSSLFEGKNLVTFGNSITAASNSWAYQVNDNLRFKNLYNGAMSAALWYKRERIVAGQKIQTQNYYDDTFAGIRTTAPAEGDILQNQQRINNCAIVHLQKYFVDIENRKTPSPDVIIFSYGTNDEIINIGDVETALIGNDLNQINIFTMAGALRWSIDTLRNKFPNIKLYVALPLQSTREGKNDDNLRKIEVLKNICIAKSVPYFDCYNESGITVENHKTYLSDGLHPNEAGKILHGAFITKKLDELVDTSSSNVQVEHNIDPITISNTTMSGRSTISVRSLKNGIPIAEVTLHNIYGNKIFQKTISDIEYTLSFPAFSGIYLLSARLTDNTSQIFKILSF